MPRIEDLPDDVVIAPGAFASSIGSTVPVRSASGEVIGTARVLDADGTLQIEIPGEGTSAIGGISIGYSADQ